jgi:DNA-binding transcriptional LysR family regulator
LQLTSPPPSAAITSTTIAIQPFMIVRPDHPLAKRSSLNFAELTGYPWIFFNRTVHPPLHDLILQRAESAQQKANVLHRISQADQVPALLTDSQALAWLTPPGAERVSRSGLIRIPLIDEHIRLETHLASQASNNSRLVSEFVRTFVKRIEIEKPSIQLPLPIDSTVMKAC